MFQSNLKIIFRARLLLFRRFPIGRMMTLHFRSALDKLARLCSMSQRWTSIGSILLHFCSDTGVTAFVASLQPSLPFSAPLRSHCVCFPAENKTVCVCVCVWLPEAVRCVCVGQMACGSSPKWNRPFFVGDIMTYLQWFLEALVALCSKVEPSRWSCGCF